MANGILVSYAGYPYALSSLFPDNGLASLAAVLQADGHGCRILDCNTVAVVERMVDQDTRAALLDLLPRLAAGLSPDDLERLQRLSQRLARRGQPLADDIARQLIDRCRKDSLDFVGFKLWSGDGFEASVRIAEQIRAACPNVKLYAGGPAVHYSGHVVARDAPVFDAVIDGDGEEALLALAALAEGRGTLEAVPNRVTTNGDAAPTAVTDLKRLPLPNYDRDTYPAVWEGGKLRLFSIDESRGCPMQCAFCINWCVEGSRWRTREVDQVLTEIKMVRERYHSTAIRLAGTYSPPAYVRRLCEGIIGNNLQISFGLSLHASGMDQKLASTLAAAGAHGIFFGVESGSDRILADVMNKKVTSQVLHQAIRAAMDVGLFTVGSFITPAPLDTPESEKETKLFILEAFGGNPHSAIILNFAGLLPRTRWWHEAERFGFTLDVGPDEYRSILLRMKIRHILPASLWPPLPYHLAGRSQTELARQTAGVQEWASRQGIGVNLPDHDALVGSMVDLSPYVFRDELRRMIFTGDHKAMQDLVDQANQAVHP